MEARLDTFATPTGAKITKYLVGASRVLHESTVPARTLHLIEIRPAPHPTTAPHGDASRR